MRLAMHAAVGRLDADQAYYRIHGQSMRASVFASALRQLEQRKAAFDITFHDYWGRIPDNAQLRAVAYRTMGRDAAWLLTRAALRRELTRPSADAFTRFIVQTTGAKTTGTSPRTRFGQALAVCRALAGGSTVWPKAWILSRARRWRRASHPRPRGTPSSSGITSCRS
jgi:hypothetical protein